VKKLFTIAGSISLLSALIVPTDQAEAAPPGSAFDPGLIISDSVFFDFGTMSVDQIQDFLDSRVSDCRAEPDGPACLKDYVMDTPATQATEGRCEAIPARSNSTAAQIIHDVANACGINPEVLIVTLQKEQGLVTSTKPTPYMYRAAMGYGCPDSDPGICGKVYVGLFNQIYRGASQLQWYGNPEGSFTWLRPGRTVNVRYSPRSSCGTKSFELKSQATANLYYYTPYTPNNAALNNLYGTGDSCSAYGNRNFWRFFHDWFGSPIGGGYLLRNGNGPLYVISGSQRFEITDPSQVQALNALGPVGEISQPYLDSFTDGGPMQLLVESSSTQEIFLLAGDNRYLLPNCELAAEFGFDCVNKLVLPSAQLLEFDFGGTLSQLLETETGQYWVEGGQYRKVFDRLGLQTVTDVIPDPVEANLDSMPFLTAGAPVTGELSVFEIEDDTRIGLASSDGIYLIDEDMASELAITKWFDEPKGVIQLEDAQSGQVPFSGFVKSSTGAGFMLSSEGKLAVENVDEFHPAVIEVSDEFLSKVPTLESKQSAPAVINFSNSYYDYLVVGSQRYTILQDGMLSEFNDLLGSSITIPKTVLSTIPSGGAAAAPGSVVRAEDSGTRYLIDGFDKKIPLRSLAQAESVTDANIYRLSDRFLERLQTQPNLTTPKVRCEGTQYFLDEGQLIPSSPQVFNQYPGEAVTLDSTTCSAMGEQDVKMTQFIRTESRDIYVVVNGEKFALTNFSDYENLSEDSLGYNWVTNWFASTIPTGTELPSETAIVTEDGATVGDFIRDDEQQDEPASEPNASEPEPEEEPRETTTYTVRAGDFLSKIAASQGVTVSEIVEANNLANPNLIRVGQVLTIPGNQPESTDSEQSQQPDSAPEPTPEPEPSPEPEPTPEAEVEPETETGSVEYRVKSGDYLSQIASRFGVSSADIAKASNLSNPNLIFVGQVLVIPNQEVEVGQTSEPSVTTEEQSEQVETYRIKAGDTLFRIAARFGVSYRDIVERNNIANPNLIRVGQVITIP
jgi:LysM repeat protein